MCAGNNIASIGVLNPVCNSYQPSHFSGVLKNNVFGDRRKGKKKSWATVTVSPCRIDFSKSLKGHLLCTEKRFCSLTVTYY